MTAVASTARPAMDRVLPLPAEFAAMHAPIIDTEPVPLCPVCGGESFSTFATGYDYELLTCANEWRFVQCERCSHVWLNPRPALSTLPVIYPPTYYAYNYNEQINPIAVKAKATLDRMKMKSIVRALGGRTPTSFMDVGCGDGRFLKLMERMGVPRDRTWGLELDEKVVAPLKARGFRALCKRVEDCDEVAPGSLDLVTMFHVIEHVDDPGTVIERIASWLSPGGVLAMETPSLDSLDARWFKRTYWGGYHIPRHWNLFRPSTLQRLLESRSLRVVGTRFQTGHSFWMYSVHHWMRYHGRPRPRLARWFNPLKGLPALACFTAFDKLRAAVGCRTSAMLMMAVKDA